MEQIQRDRRETRSIRLRQTVQDREARVHGNMLVYDVTPSAFDMILGYTKIDGEVWVCRLQDNGVWKAMVRRR
jgi:hypothetical protein